MIQPARRTDHERVWREEPSAFLRYPRRSVQQGGVAMATGPQSDNKAESTASPVERAPDGMLVMGFIGIFVLGGLAVFAWIASIG
ncbi:hypothetical protein [Roseomonas sp. WA12]